MFIKGSPYKIFICLLLMLLMIISLSSCGQGKDATPKTDSPSTKGAVSVPASQAAIEKLNPNDANSVLAAVLSSPFITCLGKTRLGMDAAFGPIAGSEWVDGMLYYHENYPGMVSYTNANIDYQVKENDTCIVVNVLLRDVVPEIVGKSLATDAGIWGEKKLNDLGDTYQYDIPIKNGFMLISCDNNGNIDLNSVIFAKIGQ